MARWSTTGGGTASRPTPSVASSTSRCTCPPPSRSRSTSIPPTARTGLLVGPAEVAGTPGDFRRYVQESAAEFSVAQAVYVDTGSGWFSDRTVRYLASGRPALVQDTGFTPRYPCGDGLLAFTTPGEAEAGARAILDDYEHHCRSARHLAEELFSAERVLGRMCEEDGVAP
jgi:hypothetical protein